MSAPPASPAQASSSAWHRYVAPAVLLLAALLATSPLLIRGDSCGHDYDFHLVSWLDAQHAWRQGILYPHWSPSSNYGAGEPRFVFYPPLTWILGAALGVILPWTLVPFAITFLLLAGTGFGTRALARHALREGPATLAGCLAIFSGYALFTAFERSDFSELAGGFWLPLLLLFVLRDRQPSAGLWRRAFDGSAALLALAFAGAWLSNDPLGVIASYLLAAVTLITAFLWRSWAPILRSSTAVLIGLSLAAFYLAPAIYEQRWVDIRDAIADPGEQIRNSWFFALGGNRALTLHDEILLTVSRIGAVMVALAILGVLVCWRRRTLPGANLISPARWWIPLALIPPAVFLLQLPVSAPLWNQLPKLAFLQFPWRWLVAVEAPMAIFLAAALWPADLRRLWLRAVAVSALACFFLVGLNLAARTFFSPCDNQDAVRDVLSAYHQGIGFSGNQEYAPRDTDPDALAGQLPDACFNTDPEVVLGKYSPDDGMPEWTPDQDSCLATFNGVPSKKGPSAEHLRILASLPRPGYLILGLRSYPAWQVRVNGHPPADMPERDDGLLTVAVPAGPVRLTVDWSTTPDVVFGRWLSALALILLAALWFFERKPSRARLS
jgi:hypothetical protein